MTAPDRRRHRILLTIPNFVTAGSGRALVNVAERLDPGAFTPLVAIACKAGAPLEQRLDDAGIEVVELDLRVAPRPYATLLLRAWRVGRRLRRLKVDVVHSFDYSDLYTEALVARLGGAHYVSTKKNMGWGSRAWFLRSWFSHRIAVQNEEMFSRFFGTRWLRGRTRYVPRGVVVEHFSSDGDGDGEAGAARAGFALAPEVVVVCSVASICRRKNQALLVRALPRDGSAHLLLAGPVLEPDYRDELLALASELGVTDCVTFTGELGDIRPALWASDVFALASRAEGSPVALLEAMSAGLPVLATTIPGVSELLVGSAGAVLVDPDDEAAATAALRRLCSDEDHRAASGRAAEHLVRSRRSIDLEVARTESMYLELLWTR